MTEKDIKHIAFIMDGNGRWAQSRGLPRTAGHHEGAQRFRDLVFAAAEMGIPYLSFYAFSKENWSRPKEEVDVIMSLWSIYMDGVVPRLLELNAKIIVVGDREELNPDLRSQIEETESKTAHCTGTTAFVMISYSARWEILQAVKSLAAQHKAGTLDLADIDEANFGSELVTRGAPDVDLLIRTSGEQRISNYMLWQLSYAELLFVDVPWPEYTPEHLSNAIDDFLGRERRFGGLGETSGASV